VAAAGWGIFSGFPVSRCVPRNTRRAILGAGLREGRDELLPSIDLDHLAIEHGLAIRGLVLDERAGFPVDLPARP